MSQDEKVRSSVEAARDTALPVLPTVNPDAPTPKPNAPASFHPAVYVAYVRAILDVLKSFADTSQDMDHPQFKHNRFQQVYSGHCEVSYVTVLSVVSMVS